MSYKVPGILICAAIAALAYLATPYTFGIGFITTALVLGIAYGNLIPQKKTFDQGVKFSEKKLLEIAIALMGLNLQISYILKMGLKTLLIVTLAIICTISISFILRKLTGSTKESSLLIGSGNAICGSSAIAAVAPVIEAKKSEVALSIGVVNLLGTIGIFIIPELAASLNFNDLQTSYLIGGTLQAVGHVVASGFSINSFVADNATIIKMIRVLMLIPTVLFFSLMNSKKTNSSKLKKKLPVPSFIIAFVLLSIFVSIFGKNIYTDSLLDLSKVLLAMAMAAIGINIKFKDVLNNGPRSLVLGTSVFIFQLIFMGCIVHFFI